MAINVFVSFNQTDLKQCEAFNVLKDQSKHAFEACDHSLKEISTDGIEQLIQCRLNEGRSKALREEIIKKFEQCAKLVVLIGNETFKNEWVEWEVNNFYKMKNALLPGKAWMSIRGMFLEGCEKATEPKALECRSTNGLVWDPEALEKWIEAGS
ncbi:MAG TPA: TIR domain-containing protein [Candidatus Omnitrophota bacterium]|nr:TIR domain-containing protein [Candidatus Omnitrophota bacterium]HRZ14712.1 TIR domain-containing protein [Candidatus Omnitrophota bacterium]